jgi:hypothetical protein
MAAERSPVVERRSVLTRATLEGEEAIVTIVERKICRRQVVERRVVEDRIEREVDKPIFALELTAAASVPVAMAVAAAIDSSDTSRDGATENTSGYEPIVGGIVLALEGIALTAVIVDALAARDKTERRTETHPIGSPLVDCGTSPANGIPVELVLSDGSRTSGRTDASGIARIGIATNAREWMDVVVAGKHIGRVAPRGGTASRERPP